MSAFLLVVCSSRQCLPLDLLSRLSYKESNSVCRHLGALRVDGDLGVRRSIRRLHFNRQQQQLQLDKTQPKEEFGLYSIVVIIHSLTLKPG